MQVVKKIHRECNDHQKAKINDEHTHNSLFPLTFHCHPAWSRTQPPVVPLICMKIGSGMFLSSSLTTFSKDLKKRRKKNVKDKAIEEHGGIWFLEHFEWGCCPPRPSSPLPVHEGQGLEAGGKTSSADKSVRELSRVVLMRLKHLVGWIPNFIQLSKFIFCITSCIQGIFCQKLVSLPGVL